MINNFCSMKRGKGERKDKCERMMNVGVKLRDQ
jgi:hypothetical protein